MPLEVPVLFQPPDSNSCVPTCVCAVLLAAAEDDDSEDPQNEDTEEFREEISELCEESALGCDLETVITGLMRGGYDAAWLPSRDTETGTALSILRDCVMNPENPRPVIVTIQTDARTMDDHAVVVTGFTGKRGGAANIEARIEIMDPDPKRGGHRSLSREEFERQWNFAGQKAFTVSAD